MEKNVTSNTDEKTVTAEQDLKLLLVKIATPDTYDSVGDQINYTYNVNNTGNVNITGPITVSDNITGTFQIDIAVLEPGQNVTGNSTHTITQKDLDNGSVTNEAVANGTFNGEASNIKY